MNRVLILMSLIFVFSKHIMAEDLFQNIHIIYSPLEYTVPSGDKYPDSSSVDVNVKVETIALGWDFEFEIDDEGRFTWVLGVAGGMKKIYTSHDFLLSGTEVPYDTSSSAYFFGFHAELKYKTYFAENMSYTVALSMGSDMMGDVEPSDTGQSNEAVNEAIDNIGFVTRGFFEPKIYYEYYPASIAIGYRYYPDLNKGGPSVSLYYNF